MSKILVYRGMADDEFDNSSKKIIDQYNVQHKGEVQFIDFPLTSNVLGESWSGILSIGTPSEILLKIAKSKDIPLFCTGTVQTNESIILSDGLKYYRWWISATDQTYLVARRMVGEIHRMYTNCNNDGNAITVRMFYSLSQADMQEEFELHFRALFKELMPHVEYKYESCVYQDYIKSKLGKGDFVYVTGYGDNYKDILKFAVSKSAVVFTDIALPILCTEGGDEIHFPPEYQSVRYLSLVNDSDSKNLFQVFVKFSIDRIAACFSASVFSEEPLHKGVYLLGEKDSIVLRKGGSLAPCLVGKCVSESGYPTIDKNWRQGVENLVCRLTPIKQVNLMKDTEALVDKCSNIQIVDIFNNDLRSLVWNELCHSLFGRYFDFKHVMIFSGEKVLFSDNSCEVNSFPAELLRTIKDKPVQVNLREYDLCDNDAYRLFLRSPDNTKTVPYCYSTEKRCPVVAAWSKEDAANKFSDSSSKTISKMHEYGDKLANWVDNYLKVGEKWLYIVPELSDVLGRGCLVFACVKKLDLIALQLVSNLINRIFDGVRNAIATNRLKLANTRSAIGSIMSRNGSHNIGSHVLAALSHNVGTMPDDRVLYQYIQQRMDYIATATTEFPAWRQPTMLVSDMMRTFLSQTHLLNYISRSDGLRAYQFQNPTVDKDSQHETIRLHIRRIGTSCKNWERVSLVGMKDKVDSFIEYGKGDGASFDKDIAVAIPGGVVGQHAFFTIIENIIRNAAKHEWSKVTTQAESNLDVYVDFHDNQLAGVVEMRIWTDCKGLKSRDVQGTIEDLTEKIKRSFISPDSGALVRENWGLAEMRIATGFLRDSGIEKIGGIGEGEGKSCDLVCPVAVEHDNKICLGYRFDFLKPKELLVIVPDRIYRDGANDKSECDIKAINRALGQFGIELMRKGKVNELSKGLPYSYIVVEDIDFVKDERLLTRMPFRILSRKPAKNPRNKGCNVIAKYVGTFYDLEKNDTIDDKLRKLRELFQAPDEVKKFAHNLLEDVYASWVNHIRNERGISSDSKLVIDVDGDGKGAAKSLVTDSDLLHFVFEHSFNSAVRGYLKMVDKMQIRPELAGALYSFAMLDCKKIMSVEDLAECKNSEGQELDVVCKIALQLIRFAEICLSKLHNSDERTEVKIDVEKTDMDGNAYVDERWTQSLRHLNLLKCLFYIYEGCKAIYNEEDGDGVAGYFDVRAFIWYLRDVVLEQARSFLSKYEERITTIPETFVSAKAIADKADSQYGTTQPGGSTIVPVDEWRLHEMEGMPVLSAVFSANRLDIIKQGFHGDGFCYWRHGDEDGKVKDDFLKEVKYFEPLSGSQSYLNSLISLRNNVRNGKCLQRHVSDNRLSAIRDMTGLVESALMRILIIDERASKFEREHPAVARIFETACIKVLDDKSEDVLQLAPPVSKFDLVEKFEIVIIHQGILDKILPDHSKQGVDAFLQKLKEHLRYVVITTGRGMPSNIPATARVLPFSVVESAMFARHPEKMLLVDTVMNILPGEKR